MIARRVINRKVDSQNKLQFDKLVSDILSQIEDIIVGVSLRGSTLDRPVFSVQQAGTMYYDTTLSKPVWWDGTNWRDAAGTIV